MWQGFLSAKSAPARSPARPPDSLLSWGWPGGGAGWCRLRKFALANFRPQSSLRHRRTLTQILEPGFDRPAQLQRQRLALAVHGLASLHADPAFGNTIFLDIGSHRSLEANADTALQLVGIEVWIARMDRQPVRRDIIDGRRRCCDVCGESGIAGANAGGGVFGRFGHGGC